MEIAYKEIAQMIGRKEETIKYMKKNNPKIFEVVKLGCLVKKYNIELKNSSQEQG